MGDEPGGDVDAEQRLDQHRGSLHQNVALAAQQDRRTVEVRAVRHPPPRLPVRPGWPPRLRSFTRSRDERSVRRFTFAAIESFEGGTEEFVESWPSRRHISTTSSSSHLISFA